MRKMMRILVVLMLSWLCGIACLFIVLQFSPPRWSVDAMSGALIAAVKSSAIYALPPLALLALLAAWRSPVTFIFAGLAATIWVIVVVAWWALDFSPIPWSGMARNIAILLPASLVPALVFYFLLRQR